MDDFDWPCERRVAHGPHPIQVWEEDQVGLTVPYERTCPGVKAHPKTMIGRPAQVSQRPVEQVAP